MVSRGKSRQLLHARNYRSDKLYAKVSSLMSSSHDLSSLLYGVASEIAFMLSAESANFIIVVSERTQSFGTSRLKPFPKEDLESLKIATSGTPGVVVTHLCKDQPHLQRVLASHDIDLLLPLVQGDNLLGYLTLGTRSNGEYSKRDIKVLRTTADELVVAIQNALSLQEIKDMNASLQQKIEASVAELRRSNARLTRLDVAKDEFLSMASHQLRTPLTSVKGYLSMVLEGDAGKITKTQRQLLTEAFAGSERMVHLIHDFLNVSRLETGRFALEKAECDLSELVKSEVAGLQPVAASRDMELKLDERTGPLSLQLDETKIRQVVMNYIDNAIYYSKPEGVIEVKLVMPKKDAVELTVTDNGIGVPVAEQSRLFSKFYRASNAKRQRPDGTGVGLYLAKKVINSHGGEVIFKSREGRGSTFGFRLPLHK